MIFMIQNIHVLDMISDDPNHVLVKISADANNVSNWYDFYYEYFKSYERMSAAKRRREIQDWKDRLQLSSRFWTFKGHDTIERKQ
jgi:hypothetical protein